MKRAVNNLTPDECVSLFLRLDDTKKRRAVASVLGDEIEESRVWTDPALYRNVLSLIVAHVSLQTWGRMRQTCRVFCRELTEYEPVARLRELFCTQPDYVVWSIMLISERSEYVRYFLNCIIRLLVHAHSVMEQFIIQNPDLSVPQKPVNFRLKNVIHVVGTEVDARKRKQRPKNKWIRIFSHYVVMYPYGYIATESKHEPLGNIFADDWKDLVYVNKVNELDIKWHNQIDKSQQAHVEMELKNQCKVINKAKIY